MICLPEIQDMYELIVFKRNFLKKSNAKSNEPSDIFFKVWINPQYNLVSG